MRKLLLLAFTAICVASCNSNAGSSTTSDSTSTMSGDSLSSGSSGSSSMQGTGSDTGYHGATMDSSSMKKDPAR